MTSCPLSLEGIFEHGIGIMDLLLSSSLFFFLTCKDLISKSNSFIFSCHMFIFSVTMHLMASIGNEYTSVQSVPGSTHHVH